MIVQLTISDARWEHLMIAKQDDLHRFYVFLADSQGQRIKRSPVRGGIPTLDLITQNSHALYGQLVQMKRRADESRMKAGLAAANAGFQLRAGDPRYDDSHPKF